MTRRHEKGWNATEECPPATNQLQYHFKSKLLVLHEFRVHLKTDSIVNSIVNSIVAWIAHSIVNSIVAWIVKSVANSDVHSITNLKIPFPNHPNQPLGWSFR